MPRKTADLYEEMGRFATEKFPDAGSREHLLKLEDEALEAANNTTDIEEYADCLLCLFGAAHKAGFAYHELLRVANEKLEKCKKREWKKLPDGTYQHIEK